MRISWRAPIPLLCINSYGRFLGRRSVTVHLQSSTLKVGFFFSPSSSAGGCSSGISSPSSPTCLFLATTISGSGNISYSISFSSVYSSSASNYNPTIACTSPICFSIINNSSMKRSSSLFSSYVKSAELLNPSSRMKL